MGETIHNVDRYMTDLRQIISHGQKRIGFLVGAGAPMSIKVDPNTNSLKSDGQPLIPAIAPLTKAVFKEVEKKYKGFTKKVKDELGEEANIEEVLTRVRLLSSAIGSAEIYGYKAKDFENIAKEICEQISKFVDKSLPVGITPYTRLVSWVSGTSRSYPVEIFTTNYDLLFEEAFENNSTPYFDGFSGSRYPFFDAASISGDNLPSNWARLWKIHGSLGWVIKDDKIVRTGDKAENTLIYPEQLKYDNIQKQPYTALFDRLKSFIRTPDTLLVVSGFSFADSHICSVLDECLSENPSCSLMAFQYGDLPVDNNALCRIASRRSNMSVYASNGAIINCTAGNWGVGDPPYKEWSEIRKTFWEDGNFTLGCFDKLTNFFIYSKSEQIREQNKTEAEIIESEGYAAEKAA